MNRDEVRRFGLLPILRERNRKTGQITYNTGWDTSEVIVKCAIRGGGGGGYSPKIPIRVCAAQRGRDFGTPYLERGIHFRDVS